MLRVDVLTEVLQTVRLCLLILGLIALGSWLDKSNEAEDQLAAEQHAQRVQGVRQAYQQGLDEGAERELFRQQQRLAQAEGQPRP